MWKCKYKGIFVVDEIKFVPNDSNFVGGKKSAANAVFGESGGSATVSLQFHIVSHCSNCNAKFLFCNSFLVEFILL